MFATDLRKNNNAFKSREYAPLFMVDELVLSQ